MALTIFRRHLKKCPQRDRYLGTEEVRKGLNLTSWEAAQNLIAEWNRAGKVGGDRVEPVTVKEAVELYLSDVAARVGRQPFASMACSSKTRSCPSCDVSTGCSVVGVAHPGDFGESVSANKQNAEGGPGEHSQECSTHAPESSPAR